jgi:hypothetical protein
MDVVRSRNLVACREKMVLALRNPAVKTKSVRADSSLGMTRQSAGLGLGHQNEVVEAVAAVADTQDEISVLDALAGLSVAEAGLGGYIEPTDMVRVAPWVYAHRRL